MGVKFSNNASTTLATAINTTDTSVVSASGSSFPALGGSDHCYLTLQSGATIEIVKATALSTNTFTVVRAQGGTSAASFAVGTQIELRMNTALLQDVKDEGPDPDVLKVDQANNRVGILDTTPAVSLDIGSATDAVHVPSGTTAQRPTGAAGMFRWNSTEAQFEGYDGSDWGEIGGGGATLAADNFTGDGSDTTFTMAADPLSENNTDVYVDGVYQFKNTYSVSGTTLTFSEAPANGALVEVMRISASAVSVGTPDDNSVSTVKIQDDAVITAKIRDSTGASDGITSAKLATNAVATAKIADDAVTYAKIQNVSATDRLLGRDTAGAGIIEEITPANVRTMINVADGANAYAHPNHSGEVTSTADGATVIASDVVDEDNLKVSNSPTNGFFLSAQSGNTGGLTWAAAGGSYSDWTVLTTIPTNLAAKGQYVCNDTTARTHTLPAASESGGNQGDTVIIANAGSGLVTIARNSSNINSAAADGTLPKGNSVQLVYVSDAIGWFEI